METAYSIQDTLTDKQTKTMTNNPERLISWKEICYYIQTGELYKLSRSPEETERYHQFKAELKKRGTNVADNIIDKKLAWSRAELSRLAQKYPTDEDKTNVIFSDTSLYKLLKNDFPYNFEKGVYHLVLWSKLYIPLYEQKTTDKPDGETLDLEDNIQGVNPVVKSKIDRFLELNLKKTLGLTDYIWFVNYPRLQSIKSISHVHILINTEEREKVEWLIKTEPSFMPLK